MLDIGNLANLLGFPGLTRVDSGPICPINPSFGAIVCVPPALPHGRKRPEWHSLLEAHALVIAGLSPRELGDPDHSRFQSWLFDSGFIPIKEKAAGYPQPHILYVRSNLLSDVALAGTLGPDGVSMTKLGELGRFGNQLWQYLFIRMYGLRNNLRVKVPTWEGESVFNFVDERPDNDPHRIVLDFSELGDDDLELWSVDDAPRNVDFRGFFQQVPPEWREHRTFVRNLFTLNPAWRDASQSLSDFLTREQRTLVAIHVRRGDFRIINHTISPLFRLVPTRWYRTLLDQIWPTLNKPILHISTDEPAAVVPEFSTYEQLNADFFASKFAIPDHIRDFVLLQTADRLLCANSSFSVLAAVTGKVGQACYIADFERQCFLPYDPWSETSFAARFMRPTRSIADSQYGLCGARRRGLALRLRFGKVPLMETELEKLRARVRYLEGGDLPDFPKYLRRAWRALSRR